MTTKERLERKEGELIHAYNFLSEHSPDRAEEILEAIATVQVRLMNLPAEERL